MTYKQSVLRDDPISFWPLDGKLSPKTYAALALEYENYQDLLNNESNYQSVLNSYFLTDESNFGNHAAFLEGSTHFDNVTTLISHSSYDEYVSGCRIDSSSKIRILNLYKAFQYGSENKAFGIEFWLLLNNPIDTPSNIITLSDASSDTRMQIFVKDDFIYFNLYFQGGLTVTTKKQVTSWSSPLHVFASTKEKSVSIYVDGVTDEVIKIPDGYKYYSDSYTIFDLGPAATGEAFVTNGLAFYDKQLSSIQINNHINWAHVDSDPTAYSNQSNVSHFTFDQNSGQTVFSKQFINSDIYKQGISNGILFDKAGITLEQTSSPASATGTWIYSISLFSYSNFVGSEILWDSASYNNSTANNYVIVEVSYDNGATYTKINSGDGLPDFLSNFGSSNSINALVRVTLQSSDTSSGNQPRLDNLSIKIYSSISQMSDSGLFQISPASGSTYTFKKDQSNILERSDNLGIKFLDGYATISDLTNSTYHTIEFWLIYNGGSAIFSTGNSTSDLYVDGSGFLQTSVNNSVLYINGVDVTSSPIKLVSGEAYHVVFVHPSNLYTDFTINGSSNSIEAPAQASYGYITIYPNELQPTDVQTRYLSFISANSAIVNDTLTSFGTLEEYSGTNSQVNNGQPIISYTHFQ